MTQLAELIARDGVQNSDLVFAKLDGTYEIRKPVDPPWNLRVRAWLPKCFGGWSDRQYRSEVLNLQYRLGDDMKILPKTVLTSLIDLCGIEAAHERVKRARHFTRLGPTSVQRWVKEELTLRELQDPDKSGPLPGKPRRPPPSYASVVTKGWAKAYAAFTPVLPDLPSETLDNLEQGGFPRQSAHRLR